MPRRRRVEDRLAELEALRGDPARADAIARLREGLHDRAGVVVAAAAVLVEECAVDQLVAELPGAFERLLDKPAKLDPGCRAKAAIARALHRLGHWEESVFARGIAHVQWEPVWGAREDTAAELRGVCGLAYAQTAQPDALVRLAGLLADHHRTARAAAARALGDSGRPDAIPLLRYKAHVGDDEPEVVTLVLGSLLALDAESSVGFVGELLQAEDPATAESAALALGESRLDAAFPLLARWCEGDPTRDRARVGYLALAMLRSDAATDHLLAIVRTDEPRGRAEIAIRALASFRCDDALRTRVLAAAREGGDSEVVALAKEAFASRTG